MMNMMMMDGGYDRSRPRHTVSHAILHGSSLPFCTLQKQIYHPTTGMYIGYLELIVAVFVVSLVYIIF